MYRSVVYFYVSGVLKYLYCCVSLKEKDKYYLGNLMLCCYKKNLKI